MKKFSRTASSDGMARRARAVQATQGAMNQLLSLGISVACLAHASSAIAARNSAEAGLGYGLALRPVPRASRSRAAAASFGVDRRAVPVSAIYRARVSATGLSTPFRCA